MLLPRTAVDELDPRRNLLGGRLGPPAAAEPGDAAGAHDGDDDAILRTVCCRIVSGVLDLVHHR
ncbi:hypothetical protein B4U78_000685 [Microbacterium esteraromaticum]|nr:hypothetical protein B4U78_000685 [Microbacterium esteraromaticum]